MLAHWSFSFAATPANLTEPVSSLLTKAEPREVGPDVLVVIFLNNNGTIDDPIIYDDGMDCLTFFVFIGDSLTPSGGGSDCP